MGDFSHLNEHNEAAMVDVSPKQPTLREAMVKSRVVVSADCADKLREDMIISIKETARMAAIQAGKRTSDLIPLCHQISLTHLSIHISWSRDEGVFHLEALAKAFAVTGVEMEAIV